MTNAVGYYDSKNERMLYQISLLSYRFWLAIYETTLSMNLYDTIFFDMSYDVSDGDSSINYSI